MAGSWTRFKGEGSGQTLWHSVPRQPFRPERFVDGETMSMRTKIIGAPLPWFSPDGGHPARQPSLTQLQHTACRW